MPEVGIWKYANNLNPFVENGFRLSLGEGDTPILENENIAKFLDVEDVYIKREDLNPTGSHKDRGLAFQISAHIQEGAKSFVISSSGNSAISAIALIRGRKENLHIFLSEKISKKKLSRLKRHPKESKNIKINFCKKPLSEAFKFAKENNFIFLRGSTDKYGYEGFKTIAYEIENLDFDSIFIPTSSATTAKGVYEGLQYKKPLHIVQTTVVNTLARDFDKKYKPEEESIADSIVDRVGHRKEEIVKIIKKTQGHGWIVSNQEIINAKEKLQDENIITSNESAMTIAAIEKARLNGWEIKKPLCIFTGTK